MKRNPDQIKQIIQSEAVVCGSLAETKRNGINQNIAHNELINIHARLSIISPL
jgi:hypothetical protein